MKKLLPLIIAFSILSLRCLATNEVLSVLSADGSQYFYSSSSVGLQNPCAQLLFRVEYQIPNSYDDVVKFEWYENATLVKTVTTLDPNAYIEVLSSGENDVTCKITYRRRSDGLLTTGTSNVFAIGGQPIGITITQSGDAIVGCPNPVSFATSAYTNQYLAPLSAFENYYTVTWTTPSNWSTNSVSGNGRNASFIPDALSAGNVIATVHIPGCLFTKNFTQPVVRTTPAPVFSSSSSFVCAGTTSQTYSINSVCGATNYTYSISGNANCVFTANNSQTYTTSATSVNVTFPQTDFSITLSASANFPGSLSSPAGATNIIYGVPTAPTSLRLNNISCPEYTYMCDYVSPYVYNWSYYSLSTHTQTNLVSTSGVSKIVFPTNGSYNVGVSRTNTCGTSPVSVISANVTCSIGGGGGHREGVGIGSDTAKDNTPTISGFKKLTLYPNPVTNSLTIDLGIAGNNVKQGRLKGIKSVKFYNQLGILVSAYQYAGNQQAVTLSAQKLAAGVYTVRIFDGSTEKNLQVIINRK